MGLVWDVAALLLFHGKKLPQFPIQSHTNPIQNGFDHVTMFYNALWRPHSSGEWVLVKSTLNKTPCWKAYTKW